MIVVRVLAAVAKPALLSGAITASAVGGWFAYDQFGPHPDVTPFERVQSAGQRLLISEFGDTTDTIIAVDPNDVAGRTQIATIDHAPGYGVFPVLSPDGKAIAYTALAPGEPRPSPGVPALAAIIDVGGGVTPLADDVDLLIPPVWSPDSQSIVVRKNTAADPGSSTGGAGSFELLLLGRDGSRATLSSWQSAAVFPIAFAPDGSKLYFATLNNGGTNLYSVRVDGGGETNIAHLSDEIARDWRLSPDGAKLAYSVAGSGKTPAVVAMTFDLATGAATESVAPGNLEAGPSALSVARGEFSPAWRDDRTLTIASLKLDGGSDALALDPSGAASNLATNGDGIDLPLGWSPDGQTLAIRAVDGKTPLDASTSHIELLRNGARDRISDSADILIVGWLP